MVMGKSWARQPTGKAMQAIQKRGVGIQQPLRFSTKWQSMTEEEIRETLTVEGCSAKMIEQQVGWFKEMVETAQATRQEVKDRRRGKGITDEDLGLIITDITSRRKKRYKNIVKAVKESMSIGGNRMGHLDQGEDDADEEA